MRRILGMLAITLTLGGTALPATADEDTDNQLMMAQLSAMMGNVPKALETIDGVLADDPDYALAYLVRAQILERAEDFKKSADDYSQAIAKGFDHSPYIYTERGNMRAASGDFAQALADYNQALTFNSGYWPAIAGRGSALAESGDATAALADLDRALAHDPGVLTETLKTQHVQVQSRKGPPQQGTNSLSVTIQTAPAVAASYVARGKLRFAQGAYRPALTDFDEAVKRMPALAPAHFYRGLTLLALGRCQEGQDEFQAQGVRGTALFQAALAQHHDAVAKAGCAVEKL
jgi:tetratricopeptide (TPR) repeat protein